MAVGELTRLAVVAVVGCGTEMKMWEGEDLV